MASTCPFAAIRRLLIELTDGEAVERPHEQKNCLVERRQCERWDAFYFTMPEFALRQSCGPDLSALRIFQFCGSAAKTTPA